MTDTMSIRRPVRERELRISVMRGEGSVKEAFRSETTLVSSSISSLLRCRRGTSRQRDSLEMLDDSKNE